MPFTSLPCILPREDTGCLCLVPGLRGKHPASATERDAGFGSSQRLSWVQEVLFFLFVLSSAEDTVTDSREWGREERERERDTDGAASCTCPPTPGD